MPVTDFAPHARAAIDHRPSWLAMSSTLAPSNRSLFSPKIASYRRFSLGFDVMPASPVE